MSAKAFYGSAVLIAAAHEQHLLAPLALVAHVDVRRQVGARDVPDVQGAIGIGQCGGNGMADGLLHAVAIRAAKVPCINSASLSLAPTNAADRQ